MRPQGVTEEFKFKKNRRMAISVPQAMCYSPSIFSALPAQSTLDGITSKLRNTSLIPCGAAIANCWATQRKDARAMRPMIIAIYYHIPQVSVHEFLVQIALNIIHLPPKIACAICKPKKY